MFLSNQRAACARALLLVCVSLSSAFAADDIKEIVRAVDPAVVTVVTKEGTIGSGFLMTVEEKGIAVTNFHVIREASSARVRLHDDSTFDVKGVIGYSTYHDLAFLQIETGDRKLPVLSLAQKLPEKGTKVLAFGSPVGLSGTVSDGIVSSVRIKDTTTVIQTTAPISKGNSGGPLVDMSGKVVGVNTFFFAEGQNLNFAVSTKHVAEILAAKTQPLLALTDLRKLDRVKTDA